MQAFTFRSGIGDAPCEGAPDSGILIQTPEGAGEITLTANGVNITLASTIYLQAQPGGESLVVNALEGHVMVEDQVVPPGSRVHVPLDDELRATGPPSQPEPYDDAIVAVLPVDNLEREIIIPPALTAEELESALTSTGEASGAVPETRT